MTVELVKYPFDICLNRGRLVGKIRAGEGCVRVGELSEKGGQAGSRVRCLKKGGLEPSYKLCLADV